LERNAELFPKGKCKVALELFDKYESIRSTKVNGRFLLWLFKGIFGLE